MQCGERADDQVGIGTQRPPAVAFGQPVLDELESELVETDLMVEPVRPADSQSPCGPVKVVQEDFGDLLGTNRIGARPVGL